VALNPNHVRANQLLADNLLAKGSTDEAVELLERLFQYQPAAARPRLVQALLSLGQKAGAPEDELKHYERVLDLDPVQPEARAGQRRIWQQRGDAALKAGDLEAAIQAYEMAGSSESVRKALEERRRRNLAIELEMLEKAERGGAYAQALDLARTLAERYPEDRDWADDLERLERRSQLKELYQRALGALHSGDRQTAVGLLVQVVGQVPDYEEATRYLHLAVTGVDPGTLPAEPKAEEAPPAPEVKPTDQQQLPAKELNFVELLWWLVARPDRLKANRGAFGQEAEHRMGAWLASSLTWLPLFLLTMRLTSMAKPNDENVIFPILIAFGCLVAWAVIGSLGSSGSIPGRAARWATWLAGTVTLVMVFFAAASASQYMLHAIHFAAYAIPMGAVAAAIGGALGVATIVAPEVMQGVAAGALAGVAFGGSVPGLGAYPIPALAWLCIAGGLVGLGLAAALRAGLRQSLKVGRPFWLVYVALLVLGMAYVLLFVTA
jgi:Tetratricopeptide repeat